ncbi:MAG: ZIP family metal transporter [Candidatus Hodarchaeota archaeon]
MLTASFLGLIPEAIESSAGEPHFIMYIVLGGILFFFFLEKFLIWRNCQNNSCEVHSHASASIILVGDAFHNFTDGILIATAFITDFNIGIAVGITIIIHEIPQETGDFGILIHGGMLKKKAFILNLISSISTIPAAIISYYIIGIFDFLIPIFLAISSASFIYIALSDLTPRLHEKTGTREIIKQLILVMFGIIIMGLILILGGHEH